MPPDTDDDATPPVPPPARTALAPSLWERLLRDLGLRTPRPPLAPRLDAGALALLIRQHELSLGPIDEGRPLDLRGTDATGLAFPECTLHGARLQDSILHRADLSRVRDLLPEALAGSDLSGARLPDTCDHGPTLAFVERLSQNAGKLFAGLIASVAALLLATFALDDTALLSNGGQAVLPVVNTAVPIRVFFACGPLSLLGIYVTLHFYLRRLWTALATLPAVFPDGAPLERRVHPWLMSDLVRDGFPLLAARRTPLDALQELLFRLLAFGLAPLAQAALWLRLLPRHDWELTLAQSLLLVLTLWSAWSFRAAADQALRRVPAPEARPARRTPAPARSLLARGGRPLHAGILLVVLLFVAWGAIGGAPEMSESDQAWIARTRKIARPGMDDEAAARAYRNDGRRWPLIGDAATFLDSVSGVRPRVYTLWQSAVPAVFHSLRIDTVARLTEKEVSRRPDGWVDPGEETFVGPAGAGDGRAAAERANEEIRNRLKMVAGADLRGADLTGARADRALLVNADLRDVRAAGASFHQADLRRANAAGADLSFANLTFARLQGALLTGAQMPAAHLGDARLQEADLAGANLDAADLGGAHLEGAFLTRARLRGAQMVGAFLETTYLGKADLEGAYLFNANLVGAQLPGARLVGADLSDTRLAGADLSRANLSRADLSRARADRANLAGARLAGATLLGADLRTARLAGADLDGALAFRGAPGNPRNTLWPDGQIPAGYTAKTLERRDGGMLYALRRP